MNSLVMKARAWCLCALLVCAFSWNLFAVEVGEPVATTAGNAPVIEVRVSVGVRRPGSVQLPVGATINNAIAAAGGTTEYASLRRVVLRRAGEKPEKLIIDVKSIRAGKTPDIVLRQGDSILVPEIICHF